MSASKRRGKPLGPQGNRKTPLTGLAKRIVRHRLLIGVSQTEAAEELGVHVTTLARWELNTEPRGLYRERLSAWLKEVR